MCAGSAPQKVSWAAPSTWVANTSGDIKGKAVIVCKTRAFVGGVSRRHYGKEHQEKHHLIWKMHLFLSFLEPQRILCSRNISQARGILLPSPLLPPPTKPPSSNHHLNSSGTSTLSKPIPEGAVTNRRPVPQYFPLQLIFKERALLLSMRETRRNPHRVSDHSPMI